MQKIRLGLFGYGNIARGIESNLPHFSDMEAVGVFTRRDPSSIGSLTAAYGIDQIAQFKDKIDVLIMCGGSKEDIPHYAPIMLNDFNTVDSFDTHARIPQHYASMEKAGNKSGHLGLISAGWDPGVFSLARLMFSSFLPSGSTHTFWGKGVSQGHSDAIRKIEGVADGRQYTIPKTDALELVRKGKGGGLTPRDKHERVCYVVAKEGADRAEIERQIVTMPDYFADYDTTVHFISKEQLVKEHSGMPHGGRVMHSGCTSKDVFHSLELSLNLDSNPQFTSSVLLCAARAVYRLNKEGKKGVTTMLEVPPIYYYHKGEGKALDIL